VQAADVKAVRADVVVALTSDNDVRTVGGVGRAVRAGLVRSFAGVGARVLLVDAGSTDGTREAAREAVGEGLVEITYDAPVGGGELPYHGHPGRARALRAAFEAAARFEATVCAILDASLEAVEPLWIERLVAPVLSGEFDYASPYYLRRVHEGAITKAIVYPLFRALYGLRLHQPATAEFACSRALVSHYLQQEFWEADGTASAVDLWLAVEAACGSYRMCEAALGARGASSREVQVDVSTVISQVVGALFAEIEQRVDVWQRVRSSTAVPLVGTRADAAPQPAAVDAAALAESFRLGYRELREIWTGVLPPRTLVELRRLVDAAPGRFRFDDRVWAGLIYDFAVAYSQRVLPRDHLLRSLTPLYGGWLASFMLEMDGAGTSEADDRVERLCLAFEAEKRHLIARWRWPERF
jgi:hypothetical protein